MASSSAFLTGTLRCKDRESAPSPKSHFAFGSMPVSSSSVEDRKSTRLNSSHSQIPYAVSCLKKKDLASLPGHEQLTPGSTRPHGQPILGTLKHHNGPRSQRAAARPRPPAYALPAQRTHGRLR